MMLGQSATGAAKARRPTVFDPKCECMLSFSVLESLSHKAHVAFHTHDVAGMELAWLEAVALQVAQDERLAA